MNNQIGLIIGKYLVTSLIALFGLIMLIIGLKSEQGGLFIISSFNVFIGGLLAVLFSWGKLNRKVVFGIGVVCIIATVIVAYSSYKSVQQTIAHIEAREESERLVRFNLVQIRDIQRAYRRTHGRYARDWDELIDFFENGDVQVIESEKMVPAKRLTREEVKLIYGDNRAVNENMTEREAAVLASMGNPTNNEELEGFKRDTVIKPYKEEFMGSITRVKEMQKLGYREFDINELRYIPMTEPKEEWEIETRDSVPYAGDTIPTIRVEGKEPVPIFEDAKRQIVGFGNLRTNSDKATWE